MQAESSRAPDLGVRLIAGCRLTDDEWADMVSDVAADHTVGHRLARGRRRRAGGAGLRLASFAAVLRGVEVDRASPRGNTHRRLQYRERGGMPGLRERVDPGAQLLPAVSCGRAEWWASGGPTTASSAVLLSGVFVCSADVR